MLTTYNCSLFADKTNSRGNVGPLLNEVRAVVTEDKKKTELLNSFFCLYCWSSQEP